MEQRAQRRIKKKKNTSKKKQIEAMSANKKWKI
jgi:hypothetical protein